MDATHGSWNQGYGNSYYNDKPIQHLLVPFSKEKLSDLLKEASEKHLDVANRIREVATEDLVHRYIFVHGLPWETKTSTLFEAFKQYGEIEDCGAMVDTNSGECIGYGFILFKYRSGARKAIKEPLKKIGDRITACHLASKGHVSARTSVAASEQIEKKIFVRNVGPNLDPEKLRTFFSRYGEIEGGPLGLNKFSGRPKGFCIFVYKSPESAKRALEVPIKYFEGHELQCLKYDNNGALGDRGHDLMAAGNQLGMDLAFNPTATGVNTGNGARMPTGYSTQAMAGNQLGMGLLTLEEDDLAFNPGNGARMPTGYSTQAMAPGSRTIPPGFGPQPRLQGGYPTQQQGRGGAGRGYYGPGNYSL